MKISIARIIVALVLVFALLFVSCTMDTPTEEPNNNSSGNGGNQNNPSGGTTVATFNDKITALQLAEKMEWGWNLGNTLDAREWDVKSFPYNQGLVSETYWGEEKTTKNIIEFGKTAGYKTIRIPVTWCNHLIDTNYTIDPKWMARVKQVVDWAIDAGYYVILNEHHSIHEDMNSPIRHCEGYNVSSSDKEESKAFLTAVWTQICATFNNGYDEHLIFETMNEPRHAGGVHEWGYVSSCEECKRDAKILNEYNQLILNVIRQSGGNNAKRFVMIPGMATFASGVLADEFVLPTDSATGKLMVTVHIYPIENNGTYKFDESTKNQLTEEMEALYEQFVKKGIPVVIGECGVARKKTHWDETGKEVVDYVFKYEDRFNCQTYLSELAGRYKMAILNWDAGVETGMATIDRKTLSVVEPQFLTDVLKAYQDGKKAGIPSSGDEPGGNSSNPPAEVEGNLVVNGTFDNGTSFSVYGTGATTALTAGAGVEGTKALAVTQNETWGELQINLSEQYTVDKDYYVEVSAKDNGSTGSNKALGISFIVVSGAVWDTFGEEYYNCDGIYGGQVMSSDDVLTLGLVSNPYVALGSGYTTASAVIPAAEIARLLAETTETGDPSLKLFIVKIHAGGQEDTGYSYYVDNVVVKELD